MKKIKLWILFPIFLFGSCSQWTDDSVLRDNDYHESQEVVTRSGGPTLSALLDTRGTSERLRKCIGEAEHMLAAYPETRKMLLDMYREFGQSSNKITFKIDPQLQGMAAFDWSENTIYFRSLADINTHTLMEEILHAAQYWLFGLPHMLDNRKNIEYEAKVFVDAMMYYRDRNTKTFLGIFENESSEIYTAWLEVLYSGPGLKMFNERVEEWQGEPGETNKDFYPALLIMYGPRKK